MPSNTSSLSSFLAGDVLTQSIETPLTFCVAGPIAPSAATPATCSPGHRYMAPRRFAQACLQRRHYLRMRAEISGRSTSPAPRECKKRPSLVRGPICVRVICTVTRHFLKAQWPVGCSLTAAQNMTGQAECWFRVEMRPIPLGVRQWDEGIQRKVDAQAMWLSHFMTVRFHPSGEELAHRDRLGSVITQMLPSFSGRPRSRGLRRLHQEQTKLCAPSSVTSTWTALSLQPWVSRIPPMVCPACFAAALSVESDFVQVEPLLTTLMRKQPPSGTMRITSPVDISILSLRALHCPRSFFQGDH